MKIETLKIAKHWLTSGTYSWLLYIYHYFLIFNAPVFLKMYNLLILSLILDLLDFAVGSAIPQVTTLPQKRDASVVTLNIGELSSYQKTLVSMYSGSRMT